MERLATEDCDYVCEEVATCLDTDYSHIGSCSYLSCTSSCDTGQVCFVDYEFKGLPGEVNRADCMEFEAANAEYWIDETTTNGKCSIPYEATNDCSTYTDAAGE